MVIKYANMDLETADTYTQELIQSARNAIIYSESWVANGISGRIKDSEGNTIFELPTFSEIFPADWDMPAINTCAATSSLDISTQLSDSSAPKAGGDNWQIIYQGVIRLQNPSETQNTAPFKTISTTAFEGTPYEYSYKSVITSGSCSGYVGTYNIGYSNAITGKSLGFAVNLTENQYFEIDPPKYIRLAIRASTYDNRSLEWDMEIAGNVVELIDY